MAVQPPSRLCPTCRMPVPAGQRFCSNCGSLVSDEGNRPTSFSGENPQFADMNTVAGPPTPPPPPNYDAPAYTQYPSTGQQTPPPPPNQGQYGAQQPVVPSSYATPQQGSSGRVWRRIGCITGIVLLILLGICGTGGYLLYRGASKALSSVHQTATATGGYISSGGTTHDVTPTSGPATTTPIGSTITYASTDITIVNVQQAQNFADDSSTSSSQGVARINLKEQNAAAQNADYVYNSIARLMLPDGSEVEPLNEQYGSSPNPAVSRTNWLDFPVATTVDPGKLTLVLGTADDAQISVPLSASADLTKYKPKTSSPNKTFQHEGLNWTMTSATASLSSTATQAKKGMMYVTIDLTIDNPSQSTVSEYWNTSMRLKAGDVTSSPETSGNLPTDYPAGSTGKTGNAIFLVPQGNTAFTFILLANSSGSVPQTSVDFQI